jgi:uncharacterized protein (TIRG00374 family)
LVHVALAVAVVGIVVARSHPRELWSALSDVDLSKVALAVLLNALVLVLAPLRSSLVFRKLGYSVPIGVLVPTTIVGFVAGGLTPAASGELLRAGTLRSRAGVAFEDSVVAVIYERALGTYLLALSTAALLAATNLPAGWIAPVFVGCIALYLVPAVAALVVSERARSTSESEGWVTRAVGRGLSMFGRLRFLLRDVALLVQASLISAAIFAVITIQYWLLARSVSGGINLFDAWLALGISTLAAVITLIPLGLGILDSSLAAVLDRLGLTLEQGAVVALLVRAAVTLPLVLVAFACYLYLQQTSPVDQDMRSSETA